MSLWGITACSVFSLIQKAERFITTSMAEGFGLAFLEPWLHGKPLIGRDLPQITTDFSNKGIKLDSLYHRLLVPLDTFDHPSLRNKVSSKLSESYQSYRVEIDPNAVDQAIASNLEADRIDFGFLDEDHQQQVISRAIDSPQLQSEIFEALDHKGPSPEIIETNRDIVAQNYSLDGYGHRLDSLYQTMLAETAGPVDAINKHAILEQFLSPARFTLLRS